MRADLPTISAERAGIRPGTLEHLDAVIRGHIRDQHYHAAQLTVARHGSLVCSQAYGEAAPGLITTETTLFPVYSNTKVVTAALVWILAERGLLSFNDYVADHVPDFGRHGKGAVKIMHLLTHQAGFPDSHPDIDIPVAAYEDHRLLKEVVCDFKLQWEPGSRVVYHYNAAHWAIAVLVEEITGKDFRLEMKESIFDPLGLSDELFIGIPKGVEVPVAAFYELVDGKLRLHPDDNPNRRSAGIPAGGIFGTAQAMAAFYQALLNGGSLNGRRILGPQTLNFVLRDVTGDRVVGNIGYPLHFALGPYTRGNGTFGGPLGVFASPRTFGHTGMGNSLCWGDPETGVSFAYVTNTRSPEDWHAKRLNVLNQILQSGIL